MASLEFADLVVRQESSRRRISDWIDKFSMTATLKRQKSDPYDSHNNSNRDPSEQIFFKTRNTLLGDESDKFHCPRLSVLYHASVKITLLFYFVLL